MDNDIKEAFREEMHRVGRQHEQEGQTILSKLPVSLQCIYRHHDELNF